MEMETTKEVVCLRLTSKMAHEVSSRLCGAFEMPALHFEDDTPPPCLLELHTRLAAAIPQPGTPIALKALAQVVNENGGSVNGGIESEDLVFAGLDMDMDAVQRVQRALEAGDDWADVSRHGKTIEATHVPTGVYVTLIGWRESPLVAQRTP